jgi:hypothetical protein
MKNPNPGKVRGNAKPCVFGGVHYRSYRNAAIENGVSYVALKQRVNGGQSHDDALLCLIIKKRGKDPECVNPMKLPAKPYKTWPDGA